MLILQIYEIQGLVHVIVLLLVLCFEVYSVNMRADKKH